MKQLILALILVLFLTAAAFAAININTAAKDELMTLPGIGQVKAEAIVKYREQHGPFKSADELKNVKGIGDKTFAKIKGELMVGAEAAPAAAEKPAAAKKEARAEEPKAKPKDQQPTEDKKK